MSTGTFRSVTFRASLIMTAMLSLAAASCGRGPQPGTVLDEALQAKVGADKLTAADDDYFHDMDRVVANQTVQLTPNEIKGRNTWIVWTGGNDRFWDSISATSFGALDFLKTLSSHPGQLYNRDSRWKYLGLVNEPCFTKATAPDPNHFGLWLDQRVKNTSDCRQDDPFANDQKYPGVKTGARGTDLQDGKKLPVGSYYGEPTGIVGLRLFPNPAFDAAAARRWNPDKYYTDPQYYLSKDLVKPYRVGMSCAFCHVGPNPVNPPADPEHPKWENLSSNVGAQYFWVDRVFDWDDKDWDLGQSGKETSYFFQLFHTARPGSLDTSLVSTDNINNPRTMNAVYQLLPRLKIAKEFHKEILGEGSKDNKQFNDYPQTAALNDLFRPPTTVWSPRVLKDGADSVGGVGALNRVYINIGLFSEEWLLHFRPLLGGQDISPIKIVNARKNSSYWNATEAQTADLALFFVKTTLPHKLKDAPAGDTHLRADAATLTRGKEAFADRCARCHSSKHPPLPAGLDLADEQKCVGTNYMSCWDQYWAWTKTADFRTKMKDIVLAPDFLDDNALTTDLRVPVTLLQTNACSPLATNAIEGNIWHDFSSDSYKHLPSVGEITTLHPTTGKPFDAATGKPGDRKLRLPGGGRGFTRPASLASVWSTAPYLLNNTVGELDPLYKNALYNPAPSVEARMRAFDDGIEKMLWPEKRERDPLFPKAGAVPNDPLEPLYGVIDRTTTRSYINIAVGFIPDQLRPLLNLASRFVPFVHQDKVQIGPIPKGTPVGLIASLDVRGEGDPGRLREVVQLVLKAKADLRKVANASDDEARKVFDNLVPDMLRLSKCPDYVVNKGHYFGTDYLNREPFPPELREVGLSDGDKRALIEFLKTF